LKHILPAVFVWALFLALAATSLVHAADLKLGFVDAMRLLEDAPQARDATARLQREFASREEEIAQAQSQVMRMEERLNRDGPVMSEAERRNLGLDVLSRKRELRRMQEEFREDVNIRRSDALGNLQELIKETIQEVGDAGGFDLIFFEGIAYANPALDITDDVLEGLTRRYQATSPRR
jgi:outer membrane protein